MFGVFRASEKVYVTVDRLKQKGFYYRGKALGAFYKLYKIIAFIQ